MQMTPVISSQVLAIGYDPATQDLGVQFASGGTYLYHGVPAETHAELMAAESVGRFIGQRIKPVYSGTRPDGSAFGPSVPKTKAAPAPKSAAATPDTTVTVGPAVIPAAPSDSPVTWDDVISAFADASPAAGLLLQDQPVTLTGVPGLTWFGELLKASIDELAYMDDQHAERRAPLVRRIEVLKAYFGDQVEAITRETVPALGGRKSLDAGGFRFSLTTQPARLELADRDAALTWAKENLPEAITAIPARVIPASETLTAAAVAEAWKASGATVEAVPPGFNLVPESQKFSYKPLAGKEG